MGKTQILQKNFFLSREFLVRDKISAPGRPGRKGPPAGVSRPLPRPRTNPGGPFPGTKGNPESLVFATFDGREYADTPTTFRDAVEAMNFNRGITDQRQKVVFHTLRHSYASWLVEAGTDIYSVKELLGHGTIAMTERYSHLSPESLENAVKRLPSLTTGDRAGKVVKLRKKT